MSFDEPLIVQKLSAQMGYLSERQALLAQNIANIDTPTYRAQDLKKIDFDDLVQAHSNRVTMRTTSGKHLQPLVHSGMFDVSKTGKTFEKKPVGNNISLEEQMGKVSDVGAQNQLATTLLHKFHQLYRTAVDNKA